MATLYRDISAILIDANNLIADRGRASEEYHTRDACGPIRRDRCPRYNECLRMDDYDTISSKIRRGHSCITQRESLYYSHQRLIDEIDDYIRDRGIPSEKKGKVRRAKHGLIEKQNGHAEELRRCRNDIIHCKAMRRTNSSGDSEVSAAGKARVHRDASEAGSSRSFPRIANKFEVLGEIEEDIPIEEIERVSAILPFSRPINNQRWRRKTNAQKKKSIIYKFEEFGVILQSVIRDILKGAEDLPLEIFTEIRNQIEDNVQRLVDGINIHLSSEDELNMATIQGNIQDIRRIIAGCFYAIRAGKEKIHTEMVKEKERKDDMAQKIIDKAEEKKLQIQKDIDSKQEEIRRLTIEREEVDKLLIDTLVKLQEVNTAGYNLDDEQYNKIQLDMDALVEKKLEKREEMAKKEAEEAIIGEKIAELNKQKKDTAGEELRELMENIDELTRNKRNTMRERLQFLVDSRKIEQQIDELNEQKAILIEKEKRTLTEKIERYQEIIASLTGDIVITEEEIDRLAAMRGGGLDKLSNLFDQYTLWNINYLSLWS